MKRPLHALAAVAAAITLLAAPAWVGPALAAPNAFEIAPAVGGGQTFIRRAPTYIDARVLAANVSETHTVPATARIVVFSADCNFYAKPGASAAVPAADVTDGTASEQNPAGWELAGVTQISLIAAASCKVTMSFYS